MSKQNCSHSTKISPSCLRQFPSSNINSERENRSLIISRPQNSSSGVKGQGQHPSCGFATASLSHKNVKDQGQYSVTKST